MEAEEAVILEGYLYKLCDLLEGDSQHTYKPHCRRAGRCYHQTITKMELDELEKMLKEHEMWLNKWVEKQRSLPMNCNPVIKMEEMQKCANMLETYIQNLVQKKPPHI
jgi:hypothetical protein